MKFKNFITMVMLIVCFFIINEKSNTQKNEFAQNNSDILQKIKNETNFVLENNKLLLPCVGVLTSRFGYRESKSSIVSKNHKGIDIGAKKGTAILAAHDGIVLKAEIIGNYGKCVILQNDEYITLYAHCSKILVNQGDKVFKGEKIAEVGMTRKCNR